jgi:hypothetical protein
MSRAISTATRELSLPHTTFRSHHICDASEDGDAHYRIEVRDRDRFVIAMRGSSRPPPRAPHERLATHEAVLPRAADGCIAGMMREPKRARLTSDAALLLW